MGGTTDSELNKMVKDLGIKNYRGCFMRNELPPDKPWSQECGIINFESSSDGSGTHWSVWYKNGDTKIFYDSFGTNPPKELVNYLGGNILSSTFQIQNINSDICGELCILVLFLLDKGHSFEEIILDCVYGY